LGLSAPPAFCYPAIAEIKTGKVTAMPARVAFIGRFKRVNEAFLRERANRKHDPRHIFYSAMLENDTYEAYEAEVGTKEVIVETFNPPRLINGHTEMWYARHSGWIENVL
jgi:hypothetical protein